jgi:hypothetical protein
MNTAKTSGMSTMRSEKPYTRKTYVTFRLVGDKLDPDQITRIMRIFPTIAYAKGKKYPAGKRTGELIGKTGVWCLSTDSIVASDTLQRHLAYILGVLIPDRQDAGPLLYLQDLLSRDRTLRADLRCFWHGRAGARSPPIPKLVIQVMKSLPATIEPDFDVDSDSDQNPGRDGLPRASDECTSS